jgi:hypothetical protein
MTTPQTPQDAGDLVECMRSTCDDKIWLLLDQLSDEEILQQVKDELIEDEIQINPNS